MDVRYDYEAICTQIYRTGHQSKIADYKLNGSDLIGFDKSPSPTCFKEHSYPYDSYDAKCET